MAIKELRMLRRGVDVTVVVGHNKYGGDVLARLTFTRDQLAEVLAPLEKLALEEAMSTLSTSVTQKDVDERVRAEVAEKVGPAKEAAKRNARQTLEKLLKDVEAELQPVKQRVSGEGEAAFVNVLPDWRVSAIQRRLTSARELLATTFKAAS